MEPLSFIWAMHLPSCGFSLSLPGHRLIATGMQLASRRRPIATVGFGLCSFEGPFLQKESLWSISK